MGGLVIHHLNKSRSQRVLWLFEELNVPYTVEKYQRDPVTMRAPKTLRQVHPLGKSPVITDNGVVVAESGLIMEYMCDKHGKGALRPAKGSPEELQWKYWLHYSEGSAMVPVLLTLLFKKMATDSPWFIRPVASLIAGGVMSSFVQPENELHMKYCNDHLSKNEYFCGSSFTAADVEMSFPMEALSARGGVEAPAVKAWLEKVHARPAYKKALERGDKEFNVL